MPKITLIAAYAARRCIGINNTMPWHLPEDFAFPSNPTLPANPSLWAANMGIAAAQTAARPSKYRHHPPRLSGRRCANGGLLEDALALCQGVEEVIIMGGAQIYAQALPIATDLRLTEVGLDVDGDAFFPEFSTETWQEASRENHVSAKGIEYAFVHYVKA